MKFRSQTSDNMDRWKAEVVRAREEKRKKENRREEDETNVWWKWVVFSARAGWRVSTFHHSYYIPPFNPGIFGGGKAKKIWEIFHLTTWNIPPPHVFGASKRCGGGSSGCNILAQRWYGTAFYFEHTYIHTCMHTYIHTYFHTFIYIYTYMYLNTHNVCIYIIWVQTYLQKNATVKFWGGVVAKPWYFTVLAGSPPKKSIANAGGPSCFLPLR